MMSPIEVGLVDTTGQIDPKLVEACAHSLDRQVAHDLAPAWGVKANVQYVKNGRKMPTGLWLIRLVKKLPPHEGGFHQTKHNQPYAEVIASADDDSWTIDASHELCEMLIDPYGNKMQSSKAIRIDGKGVKDTEGQFNYLVEACDPCQAKECAYKIGDIHVSDCITPHYYDEVLRPDTRYSLNGAVKSPRQVLPGGYISYVNEVTDEIEQIVWVDPTQPPRYKTLGKADQTYRSLRAWIDATMAYEIRTARHR
jgi:hypothetical protein